MGSEGDSFLSFEAEGKVYNVSYPSSSSTREHILVSLKLFLDTFVLEVGLRGSDGDNGPDKSLSMIVKVEKREIIQNILSTVERWNEEEWGKLSYAIDVVIDRKHDGNVFNVPM